MSRWFRMYDDLLDDPKVQKLPAPLFKAWVNLLCLASRNDGKLPAIEDVAFALRQDEKSVRTTLNDLFDRGLLDTTEADEYSPHNWDSRQYKSDSSTERSKKHRATKTQQPLQQECNVAATVDATPPETEQSRADTERKVMSETSSDVINFPKKKRGRNDYPEDFQKFYEAYPSDPGMSKPEALKQWLKLSDTEKTDAFEAIPQFIAWVSEQGKDYRTVHACRYLSQKRFEGFIDLETLVTRALSGQPVKENESKVFVKRGTPAWEAWQKIRTTPVSEKSDGWWFSSEYPPREQPELKVVN